MARCTEAEFKKMLAAGEFPKVCVIYGEEDYLKKHYVSLLIKKSVDEAMADFNLHRINGETCTVDDIFQADQALPFMSEKSCVVVKDFALDKADAATHAQLLELLDDLAEDCVLVFWQDSVGFDEKKNNKVKELTAKLDENGVLLRLDRMTGTALYKTLEGGAQKRGCSMSRDVSSYMVGRVGDELTMLLNELDKLCFYKGEGEITRRDVDAVCTRSLDAKIFDLSKALTNGTAQKALDILSDLFARKEKPVMILGTLIATYVDMYRARIALGAGQAATAPAKVFDYRRKEFRLTNGANNSRALSIRQLRQCLELLAQADMKMKSTALEERHILEETILQLILIEQKSDNH